MFIYFSCGFNFKSVGFDFRYVNKRFIFIVSIRSKEWSIEFNDVKIDVFYVY